MGDARPRGAGALSLRAWAAAGETWIAGGRTVVRARSRRSRDRRDVAGPPIARVVRNPANGARRRPTAPSGSPRRSGLARHAPPVWRTPTELGRFERHVSAMLAARSGDLFASAEQTLLWRRRGAMDDRAAAARRRYPTTHRRHGRARRRPSRSSTRRPHRPGAAPHLRSGRANVRCAASPNARRLDLLAATEGGPRLWMQTRARGQLLSRDATTAVLHGAVRRGRRLERHARRAVCSWRRPATCSSCPIGSASAGSRASGYRTLGAGAGLSRRRAILRHRGRARALLVRRSRRPHRAAGSAQGFDRRTVTGLHMARPAHRHADHPLAGARQGRHDLGGGGLGAARVAARVVGEHDRRRRAAGRRRLRLVEDADGVIWAGTSLGLARLHADADVDPPRDQLRRADESARGAAERRRAPHVLRRRSLGSHAGSAPALLLARRRRALVVDSRTSRARR